MTISELANGPEFVRPFDAVPGPTGTGDVYFTGLDDTGEPSVFLVATDGGVITTLHAGTPLAAPFGIATAPDGSQLYVSDPAAGDDDAMTVADTGLIFSLDPAGGAPSIVDGSVGTKARGLDVIETTIYFTGNDPETGEPAVMRVPTGGGGLEIWTSGAPLADPSGIAVTRDGSTAYVADTIAGDGAVTTIFEVTGGATEVITDLAVGYPAGVALTGDESELFVSGLDPVTGEDVVYRIDIANQMTTQLNMGIEGNLEPGGLHRARSANVYAFVDGLAGDTGTVYLLTCE